MCSPIAVSSWVKHTFKVFTLPLANAQFHCELLHIGRLQDRR